MEYIPYLIFIFCLSGASWQAYKTGLEKGSIDTVDKLHRAKIISYDDQGNIVPNPFFNT